MDKFLLIDGSSLIHRAFYAWPLLSNKDGQYTNAVYGLAIMMDKVLQNEKPDKVAVCFDKSRITFRTAIYADYKGTRSATPDELQPQFELAKELLDAMHVSWEEIEDFEADDIIGTLARLGSKDHEVVILTGDRDSFQLIGPHTKVLLTKKGVVNTELWDEAALLDHYGLEPSRMIDLKALMGDSSDNIPGITGVGEKTALKLLAEFGTLDEVLANAENISAKGLRAKVTAGKEQALLSRVLATIDCHMEDKFAFLADLTRYEYQAVPLIDNDELKDFYKRMNFVSLLKPIGETAESMSKKATVKTETVAEKTAADDWSELGGLFAVPTAKTDWQALSQKLAAAEKLAVCSDDEYLAICCDDDSAVELIAWVELAEKQPVQQKVLELLAATSPQKICFGAKNLIVRAAALGIAFDGIAEDIELMAYLLDPGVGSYQPYLLNERYLNGNAINPKSVSKIDLLAFSCTNIMRLLPVLSDKLQQEQLTELYRKLELPLSKVLAEMELSGIVVEKDVLADIDRELAGLENTLTAEIYQLAGREFNINSPKQLGEILFVDMGIPPVKKTKTGFSTDVEVMEQLSAQYPIAEKILAYRSCSKLRSTYAVGLQALIKADGRIHTSFNQTVTATGRLSSTEPNLQNIPVREEMGRRLRLAFKPAPGCKLLAADYSQIELRVLAHISNDKVLQNSFIAGEDIHARTAAEVFGIDIAEVTKEQRRRAKAVNFGIVYGISGFGLAKDLHITKAEAQHYIDTYLARYDGVRAYMHDIVETGKKQGYVTTVLGRKRWLPDLKSSNFNRRSFAERTALNTPIQGSAADIIKLAMLKVAAALKAGSYQSRMILQVHDELIFEVPEAEIELMQKLVKKEMEQAYQLLVPMTVDVKIGDNWHDMQSVGQ